MQAFATLREYAQRRAVARVNLGRAMQLLQHSLPSKAWRTWAAHASQQRELRRKAAAVVTVITHGDLHRGWTTWHAYVQARHAKRGQVRLSVPTFIWTCIVVLPYELDA